MTATRTADKANKARAGAPGHSVGWRHALGRRVLHGEVTVQTPEGVKTLVMARGQVTALSKDAVTVKSSDGVETSFGIDGESVELSYERFKAEGRRGRVRGRREVGRPGRGQAGRVRGLGPPRRRRGRWRGQGDSLVIGR